MAEVMTSSVQSPVIQSVPPTDPVGQPLVQTPPVEGSNMTKWWILAGVLLLVFIGIAVWYFSTR